MVFKIRYRRRTDGQESEVAIEANNPTEALVKFRHTCGHAQDPAGSSESVTTVPEDTEECDPSP